MKPDKTPRKKALKAVAEAPRVRRAANPASQTVTPTKTKPKPGPAKKSILKIPPLLLEGDASPPPPVSGPGQRYALGQLRRRNILSTPKILGSCRRLMAPGSCY